METPNPQTAFGGKPMGGLARIVHEYFPAMLAREPDLPVPAEVFGPDRGEPYVHSHGTHCTVCGSEIKVMCFQMTTVCSEVCRKIKDGEIKANLEAKDEVGF